MEPLLLSDSGGFYGIEKECTSTTRGPMIGNSQKRRDSSLSLSLSGPWAVGWGDTSWTLSVRKIRRTSVKGGLHSFSELLFDLKIRQSKLKQALFKSQSNG